MYEAVVNSMCHISRRCLKPDVFEYGCSVLLTSLHVGNQLLVLCWSWCDAVPLRKGRRHLHWEGSCRFIFFPVNFLFFTATSCLFMSSAWKISPPKRGQLCHFNFVCGLLIKTDKRGLALHVLTRIIIMFYLYLTFWIKSVFSSVPTVIDYCMLCRCEPVLWVHVSPMLHP